MDPAKVPCRGCSRLSSQVRRGPRVRLQDRCRCPGKPCRVLRVVRGNRQPYVACPARRVGLRPRRLAARRCAVKPVLRVARVKLPFHGCSRNRARKVRRVARPKVLRALPVQPVAQANSPCRARNQVLKVGRKLCVAKPPFKMHPAKALSRGCSSPARKALRVSQVNRCKARKPALRAGRRRQLSGVSRCAVKPGYKMHPARARCRGCRINRVLKAPQAAPDNR